MLKWMASSSGAVSCISTYGPDLNNEGGKKSYKDELHYRPAERQSLKSCLHPLWLFQIKDFSTQRKLPKFINRSCRGLSGFTGIWFASSSVQRPFLDLQLRGCSGGLSPSYERVHVAASLHLSRVYVKGMSRRVPPFPMGRFIGYYWYRREILPLKFTMTLQEQGFTYN